MFWKTTVPLLIILMDSNNYVTEILRIIIFLTVSFLALCYWINKTSKDYLEVQNITWQEYFKLTYRTFVQRLKK